jgi:eukaryotic-like serine/threonine-protein kinase
MPLREGTRLGGYEVLAPLGAGGMDEVYRARDTKLDREVALKVLPQDLALDSDALARFEREAKAVAALSHPGILAIFDFGRADGVAYAVTELLDLDTLRVKLADGPLPARKAVDYQVGGVWHQPGTDSTDDRELPLRSGLDSMRRCPAAIAGLRRAGFTGGWL